VLASGWVTTGPEVLAFEREFAHHVGASEAVAVASCTAAIELSFRAMRLPAGAPVLVPTMTFSGAVQAIGHARLRPVLVDVDPVSMMPGADDVAAAVRRGGGADAMLVTHYAGAPSSVDELAAAAGLGRDRIVEDAAHALGTSVGREAVGTIGAATCFSFYATKNLPIGEGGMITTDDPGLADFIRRARLHGMSRDAWRRYLPGGSWRYDVEIEGLKANMPDLSAAIGRAQLRHVDRWQRRRDRIAQRYTSRLSGIGGLRTPKPCPTGVHAWHLYVLHVLPDFRLDRDSVIDELAKRGIGTSVHFIPVHQLAYFRQSLAVDTADFPGAELAATQILSLPIHPLLTDEEVDTISGAIDDLARGG
jgi:dTDP-4-amino-4,6-dideoxygalactose transaminase